MRILLCQINPTIGDFAGNAAKIRDGIAAGRSDGVDLVLFPELSLSGYPPEDLLLHDDYVARCEEELQKLIPETKGVAAAVGLPRRLNGGQEKALGNSAAIISDGKLLGYYDKVLLPTYDIFDERRYFDAGEHVPTWEIAGERVAVTICEDIWQHSEVLRWSSYDRDPIAELIAHTPDVVVNLSASPFSTDKPVLRADVCRRAAKTLGCPVVMCNQVGANDSLIFDGHSTHADAQGRVVAYADGFVEQNLVVDTGAQGVTEGSPVFASDPTASLHDALVLGIRDYFHKQGFKKACIGLSGGIDSTVVAVLAVEALGADNVLGITMPSRYSSEGSVADSQALAKNLGIDCWELPIEAPFASFLELLEPHFEGRQPDTTEENLQARIRGMLLMAVSNKFGCIVLSTGNKSEFALGYSTLYGDMAGGLSVISDVSKGQVYALARWMNRNEAVVPQACIDKPPSAELRPDQKDSDSLPPYDLIDTVLEEHIEHYATAGDIVAKHGYALDLVEDIIRRIHQNEYKRRQAAPGLRVTSKAFSVGRRFPIVQSW